jgi:N6-adenosine-specific RNA methylase IME4
MANRATPPSPSPSWLSNAIEFRPTGSLRPHPEAGRVPAIGRPEFQAFKEDISLRGLLVPLEVSGEGVVLDGHLRLRAAVELGFVAVPVRVVAPGDEVEYLLLAALQRRHLTASQRAALVVELDQYRQTREAAEKRRLANLKGQPGVEVAGLPPRGKTRDLAAGWAGVSGRTVGDAALVHDADPELFEQVKQGRLPVDRAARRIRQRLRDAALPAAVPLPDGLFNLIYGDPPWLLPGSADGSRSVQNHYPCMPLDAIKALPVPAADDAILFLWGVNSLTPEAIEVIQAWGFDYLGNFAWPKDKIGLGTWNRNQHELLHMGRRGNFPTPPPHLRPSSLIFGKRGRHSQKPDSVYAMLERAYPSATKLELFCRGKARPGWTAWGNEAANA